MQAYERLQLSAHVQPILMSYPSISEAYIPIEWSEESAIIPDEIAKKFYADVTAPMMVW